MFNKMCIKNLYRFIVEDVLVGIHILLPRNAIVHDKYIIDKITSN